MITGFFTIGLLQTLAVISPGPDFAMVVRNTLAYSRRTGIFTTAGITTGVTFHLSYCLLGFAVLIHHTPFLFNIVKFAGSAYLIYIGFKELFSKNGTSLTTEKTPGNMPSDLQAFHMGLFCNLLNPKVALYFIGLFTLVISADTPLAIQLSYGLEILLLTFLWFFSLTMMLTHPKIEPKLKSFQKIISRLMGVLLILFGTRLAMIHF